MKKIRITPFDRNEWRRLVAHDEPGIGVLESARRWCAGLLLIIGLHMAGFLMLSLIP
ncbi:MAG: hypothetical protein BroJett012_20540 [Betaproteobacteria bacterium]|nr:MAG: hypothetical protein BroJett012_20540 [Betaproteobacteria bacterium]